MTVWFDEEHEAVVVKMPLPPEIEEAVTQNDDGTHTIVINDRISDAAAVRAYRHALRHIERSDFDACDVQAVEVSAHESA